MSKKIVAGVAALLLHFDSSLADMSGYILDDKIEAVFAGLPQFTGEVAAGKGRVRAYNYVDEQSAITYSVTIAKGVPGVLREKAVPRALAASIQGNAASVNGQIVAQRIERIGQDFRAVFAIRHIVQGHQATKYSVVIYHGGNFYSWSVSEFVGVSTLSGQKLFDAYLPFFRIL